MNKEITDYKNKLIKSGFVVFDEQGNISNIITESELLESIKSPKILEEIERIINYTNTDLTGITTIVKRLDNLINQNANQNTQFVYIKLLSSNEQVQGYVELNKFAIELQNKGYILSIKAQEETEPTKKEQLINKINKNKNLFKGSRIRIAPKRQIFDTNEEKSKFKKQ